MESTFIPSYFWVYYLVVIPFPLSGFDWFVVPGNAAVLLVVRDVAVELAAA